MEMCMTWIILMLDLTDYQANANIHKFIMNVLDPAQPATKLFHAVSKMFSRDRHIFCFQKSASQGSCSRVTGFLKGLWEGIISTNKFHNFLWTEQSNDLAIHGGTLHHYAL